MTHIYILTGVCVTGGKVFTESISNVNGLMRGYVVIDNFAYSRASCGCIKKVVQ